MEDVMNDLVDKLVEFAEEDVYKDYKPLWYERTNSLKEKDNWDIIKPRIYGDGYIKAFINADRFKLESLTVSGAPRWQHGITPIESANGFIRIINEGRIGHAANFPQLGSRPFWWDFCKWVDENLDRLITEKCIEKGLPIVRTTGVI